MLYTQYVGSTAYTIDVKEDWLVDDEINFGDFDRLENNVIVMRNYLQAIQYAIPSITTVTNRAKTFIDFISSINRIEQNLETIRANFATPPEYGGTKLWLVNKGFDFNDANRLEGNIRRLFVTAGAVYESFVRCGTIRAGYSRGDLAVL
jgi:hypothetical protein